MFFCRFPLACGSSTLMVSFGAQMLLALTKLSHHFCLHGLCFGGLLPYVQDQVLSLPVPGLSLLFSTCSFPACLQLFPALGISVFTGTSRHRRAEAGLVLPTHPELNILGIQLFHGPCFGAFCIHTLNCLFLPSLDLDASAVETFRAARSHIGASTCVALGLTRPFGKCLLCQFCENERRAVQWRLFLEAHCGEPFSGKAVGGLDSHVGRAEVRSMLEHCLWAVRMSQWSGSSAQHPPLTRPLVPLHSQDSCGRWGCWEGSRLSGGVMGRGQQRTESSCAGGCA